MEPGDLSYLHVLNLVPMDKWPAKFLDIIKFSYISWVLQLFWEA